MSEVNNLASKIELANHLLKVFRDARKAKIDEKDYEHAKKHLFSINVQKIEKIVKKYSLKNPKLMEKHLHPLFYENLPFSRFSSIFFRVQNQHY